MPREALIVGFGLIGGSAGIALRDRGWLVRYIDPWVDAEAFEHAPFIDEDDLVLLATPVDAATEILRTIPSHRGAVTTACSVMRITPASGRPPRFVAGHPLAGSEQRGFAAARADLFEGKPWFLDARDDD